MIGDGKPLHSRWLLTRWIRLVNRTAWQFRKANLALRDHADELTRRAVCEYRRQSGAWPLEDEHPYRHWAERQYASRGGD